VDRSRTWGYSLCGLASFLVELLTLDGPMEVTLNETDRLEVVLKKFNRQITKAGPVSGHEEETFLRESRRFSGGVRARQLAAGTYALGSSLAVPRLVFLRAASIGGCS